MGDEEEMATAFKIFERSKVGVLARRPEEERVKMERNAVEATVRLHANGHFVTEVQEMRDHRRSLKAAAD